LTRGATRDAGAESKDEVKEQTPANLWYIDGDSYDLTEFMPKHPGGAQYLAFPGNDVSITFWSYHKDPKRNKKVLDKYKVKSGGRPNRWHLPDSAKFLLPDDFDARNDIQIYNFDPDEKNLVLNECRNLITKPEIQKEIRRLDKLFDQHVMYIVGCYLAFVAFWLFFQIPWYISTPIFALLRTALGGAGHYFTHRSQPNFWSILFDMNYIGVHITLIDGHNVGHHAPTMSKADPKTGFFGAMMALPRLVRVPAFTLHKFGHFITGIFIKLVEVHTFPDAPLVKFAHIKMEDGSHAIQRICWATWLVHVYLVGEFYLACKCGLFGSWFLQFFISLWLNTLMVVSSHDFECQIIFEKDSKDWGKFQLANCLDLTITGNPYVDVFLSAGLSPHRAHHMFPYQKSGYANVYSTPVVQAVAEKFNLKWEAPRSLFMSRLPSIFKAYILGPLADPFSRKVIYSSFWDEHAHVAPYLEVAKFIGLGFTGIGSL